MIWDGVVRFVVWLATSLVGGAATMLVGRCKAFRRRDQALRDGVESLLRSQLISFHDKYVERGYCPLYAKEAARRSYDAYHALGGNGVVTKLYDDLMALPENPPGGAP